MSNSEQITNLLSECLLKGYVMTAQHCEIDQAPLFRKRNTKETFCVVCDNNGNQEQPQVSTSIRESETKQLSTGVEIKEKGENNNAIEQSQPEAVTGIKEEIQKIDISGLLGKKLLNGYTLLDTLCQNKNCVGVPLVRNKSKISSCVKCKQEYILEKDFDLELHSNLLVNQPSSNTIEKVGVQEKGDGQDVETFEDLEKEMETFQRAHIKKPKFESEIKVGVITDKSLKNVLLEKLQYLKNNLESSFEIEKIQKLAQAIEACLSALRHIKENGHN